MKEKIKVFIYKFFDKIANPTAKEILLVAAGFASLSFCVYHSLNYSATADFFPMNGDFQNYNPWRRFLNGQVPFKDFSLYLGVGHLLFGSLLTGVLGGSFADSRFAAMFLTCVISIFTVFTASYLVTKRKSTSVLVTVFCLFAVQFGKPWMDVIFPGGFLSNALPFMNKVGNSARGIRAGIILIIPVLLLAGWKLLKSLIKNENRVKLICYIFAAAVCGASITYSNDSGVASYICASFCVLFYLIKEYKTNIKRILIDGLLWIGCSMAAYGIWVFVISAGNIKLYIDMTFGVAGYQFWYYGIAPPSGPYFVSDVIKSFSPPDYFSIAFACYDIARYFKEEDDDHEAQKTGIYRLLLAFILLGSFVSSKLYYIFSGNAASEHLNFVLNVIVIAYAFKYILNLISQTAQNKPKQQYLIGITISAVFILSMIPLFLPAYETYTEKHETDGMDYVSELGGNNYWKYDLETLSLEIGNENLFSTYTSALEVIQGRFNPTRYDYIIHALGDKARNDYVENFKNGKYPHVTNPTMAQSGYMGWVRQANWFFFRELYARYKITEEIGYLEHWQKVSADNYINEKANIKIYPVSNGGCKIICRTSAPIDAVADVLVTYKIVSNGQKGGMFRMLCAVSDPTFAWTAPGASANYNLPSAAEQLAIPITLVDGRGEVTLTPYPLEYTALANMSAEVKSVIKNPYVNDTPISLVDLTDKNWTNGVANTFGNVLLFQNNAKFKKMLLQHAPVTVAADGYTAAITQIKEMGKYIWVYLENTADRTRFAYPAQLIINYSDDDLY